ncbi:polymorphic toxin type 50 domain-containing protein, partial [Lonsdalea quercina]|uniref:polymorphic toxin type 50 domain-containing protein n=1 Tax=Lonsdalea quercina TaxID=71657 RepID=UPI003974D9AA
QIYDAETGLYYNRHRYYDADSGQYISPDPIGLAGGLRPQGYVHNPLEWVDPLGLAESGCKQPNSPENNQKPEVKKPNISTKIHDGAQGKHIPGHNNYVDGKSVIDAKPQELLDNYHAGNVNTSRVINDNKVKVDFGDVIGTHKDMNGTSTSTSWGIIHSGKNGAHIVPALPDTI